MDWKREEVKIGEKVCEPLNHYPLCVLARTWEKLGKETSDHCAPAKQLLIRDSKVPLPKACGTRETALIRHHQS